MNCIHHPDRSVARECRICHELFCSDCVVKVGDDAVCKTCLSETVSLKGHEVVREVPSSNKAPLSPDKKAVHLLTNKAEALNVAQKSRFLTVFYSLLPGLGHYYLGMQQRGLSFMIMFFGLLALNNFVPYNLQFAVGLSIPILWFFSQFDALKYRTLINQGELVEDRAIILQLQNSIRLSWLGWILVSIGAINIFYQILDFFILDYQVKNMVKDTTTALLVIGLGWWLVKGKADSFFNRHRTSDEHNHA